MGVLKCPSGACSILDLFPASPLNLGSNPALAIRLKMHNFLGPLRQVYGALLVAKKHSGSEVHWLRATWATLRRTYVEPFALRAEWEGFTTIVNNDLSAKFEKLLHSADHLVHVLPWGKPFEVDVFRRPNFTFDQLQASTCSLRDNSSASWSKLVPARRGIFPRQAGTGFNLLGKE
ncbi:hypothetical protein PCANC_06574 [Puccinia coronata f. sp. avenae]|uniref:Uncharacterized protein n=1 Tax=Puccinia coronata f. sp. avenae TaxID=200324 RepID=A0A2N5VA74_9BASI|nr:hypothetical protein PCANC_06574 [Puccinia coronata f. sp. avenae]